MAGSILKIYAILLLFLPGLIASFFTPAATAAKAQAVDDPEPGPSPCPDEEPMQRWRKIPKTRREDLLEKFRYFKSLPERDRENLRERHRKLEILRDTLPGQEPDEQGNAEEAAKVSLDDRVLGFLKGCIEELENFFGREPEGEHHPKEVRRLMKEVEGFNQERMDGFLRRMERRGMITPEELEKVRALDPDERKALIFELGRRQLANGLEGRISHREPGGHHPLDPWHFHRKVREHRRIWDAGGLLDRMIDLTPEQRDELRRLSEGKSKDEVRDRFHTMNLCKRLEAAGLEREAIDKILTLSFLERRAWIQDQYEAFRRDPRLVAPAIRRLLETLGSGPGPDPESGPKRMGRGPH